MLDIVPATVECFLWEIKGYWKGSNSNILLYIYICIKVDHV